MRRLIVGIALAAIAIGSFEVLAQQPPPQPELGLNSRGRPRVSPRRTAGGVVDGVQVTLEWGSPSKRGRVIWGTLVPWGRWWMPGADETTTIQTSAPLNVGDLVLPAGVHSIYTLPDATTFTLIINKGTDLFHTQYPQQLDLGRVPMTMATVTDLVEQLTFGVEAQADGGGRLTMTWDDRQVRRPTGRSSSLTHPRESLARFLEETVPSEVAPLQTVIVKHARDAFRTPDRIAREWKVLGFTAPPDFGQACAESDAFVALLEASGAKVLQLEPDDRVNLDSIYARDAAIVSSRGAILCRMGKPARGGEPDRLRAACAGWSVPVTGLVELPGLLEGGDFVWLADRIAAVGRGYRTNDAGIAQLRALLDDTIDELVVVPLPHWRGPGDVFHLMSIVSPVDHDLAVVYDWLLPVPFRERLIDLGYTLVEVPDDEFESMGANVLAVAPRRCVMLDANPQTRARLERAGAEVITYEGREISLKGGGGPTCLTRPIRRAGDQ